MAKNKLDYLAEALAEFGLSTASQLPATAYGGYKAATTPGGLTERLRAFQQGAEDLTYQPRGAAAQDLYSTIAENTPEALKQGLARYGEWSAENPTASIAGEALLGTIGGASGKALKREIFRGPNSEVEHNAAAKALGEIDNGADPADVWRADRWARHPLTGQPVTEIDDSQMKLIKRPGKNPVQMEQVIEHPELFKVTPGARLMDTMSEKGTGGTFYPSQDKISIGALVDDEKYLDSMAHELDHRTAKQFGLPKGGSPSQFGYDIAFKSTENSGKQLVKHLQTFRDSGNITQSDITKILDVVNEAGKAGTPASLAGVIDYSKLSAPDMKKLSNTLAAWNQGISAKNEAYDKYRNIGGEAVARLTTARRKLTGAERGEDYPFDPNYFKRLTGSDISDLTKAPAGGVVQSSFSTTSTGRPKWDELLASDKGSVQEMSPRALMSAMAKGQGTTAQKAIDKRMARGGQAKVDALVEKLRAGEVDMPVLDYANGGFQQDGFHRALAAEMLDMKKIPVAVIKR